MQRAPLARARQGAGRLLPAAALLVGVSIRRLPALLRPHLVYVEVLRDEIDIDAVGNPVECAERDALRQGFARFEGEPLPARVASVKVDPTTAQASPPVALTVSATTSSPRGSAPG